MATPSKGKDEQDNPIYFTGELRDWQGFKQELQSLADRKDYSWLFDTGKALCDFYVSQVRDKTGTTVKRKTALTWEIPAVQMYLVSAAAAPAVSSRLYISLG